MFELHHSNCLHTMRRRDFLAIAAAITATGLPSAPVHQGGNMYGLIGR